jgi:hypothetical protein
MEPYDIVAKLFLKPYGDDSYGRYRDYPIIALSEVVESHMGSRNGGFVKRSQDEAAQKIIWKGPHNGRPSVDPLGGARMTRVRNVVPVNEEML